MPYPARAEGLGKYDSFDLKATQMNGQHSLIGELMLYMFKMGHDAVESAKNNCWEKSEDSIDPCTGTGKVKKFNSGSKKLENQAKSGKTKTRDSTTVFKTIKVNPASIARSKTGELGIS